MTLKPGGAAARVLGVLVVVLVYLACISWDMAW